jgi:hypothetical protein
MGVIGTLIAGAAASVGVIVVGAVSRQVSDEFKAWTPRIAGRLLERAVKKLPKNLQERMREEWASHLAETPGEVGKLIAAWGFGRTARAPGAQLPNKFVGGLRYLIRGPETDRVLIETLVDALFDLADSNRPMTSAAIRCQLTYGTMLKFRWAMLLDCLSGEHGRHKRWGPVIMDVSFKIWREALEAQDETGSLLVFKTLIKIKETPSLAELPPETTIKLFRALAGALWPGTQWSNW